MNKYVILSTASVRFECAYKEQVKVTTDIFSVRSIESVGENIGFGDLAGSFALNAYTDPSFTTPLTPDTTIYIGEPIYTEVSWRVQPQTVANFYLDRCFVELDSNVKIELIKENCYSTRFGVEQLQMAKIVAEKSRFKFKTFISGESERMKMKMFCEVKVLIHVLLLS